MYKVMDWVATKGMVSLAGVDNPDAAGKQAMVETEVLAEKVMNTLGMQCRQIYECKWLRCELKWRCVRRFSGSKWKTACAPTVMCHHIV